MMFDIILVVLLYGSFSYALVCNQYVPAFGDGTLSGMGEESHVSCCDVQNFFSISDEYAERPYNQVLLVWAQAVAVNDIHKSIYWDSSYNESCATRPLPLLVRCEGDDGPQRVNNQVTAALDGSILYGTSQTVSNELREKNPGDTCRLRLTVDGYLPYKCDSPPVDRLDPSIGRSRCAGDSRNSDSLQLLALHTMLAHEHNRECERQRLLFPDQDADFRFIMAQRRVVALIQHITMYEWLPAIIGGSNYIPLYHTNGHSIPVPDVVYEYAFGVAPLVLSGLGDEVVFMSQTGRETYLPFDMGANHPDAINSLSGDGICAVLTGMLVDPMKKITLQTSPFFIDIDAPLSSCINQRAALVGTYKDVMELSINNVALYPELTNARSHLRLVTTLTDITTDHALLTKMRLLYSGKTDEEIADVLDLYTGLLIEDHGPSDFDVVGPLTRYIMLVQLVEHTRNADPNWFEASGMFEPDILDEIRQDSLGKMIERMCDYASIATNNVFMHMEPPFDTKLLNVIDHSHDDSSDLTVILISCFVVAITVICIVIFFQLTVKKRVD